MSSTNSDFFSGTEFSAFGRRGKAAREALARTQARPARPGRGSEAARTTFPRPGKDL